MRHITEAYDLLVDELKQKIDKAYAEMNAQSDEATMIRVLLVKQLVTYAGKPAAMEVAHLIDRQYDAGFAEWIDEDFDDPKK